MPMLLPPKVNGELDYFILELGPHLSHFFDISECQMFSSSHTLSCQVCSFWAVMTVMSSSADMATVY